MVFTYLTGLKVIKVNKRKVFQISGFQKQHLYSENIFFRWVGQGESPNYTSPKQEISMKLQRMRGVGECSVLDGKSLVF